MGSYLVKQGIVYLTLADTRYPQKLAFMFLSEISDSFKAELQNTYGSGSGVDHLSRIETIDSQYAFIKFGKSFCKLTNDVRKIDQQEVERVQRCKCKVEH